MFKLKQSDRFRTPDRMFKVSCLTESVAKEIHQRMKICYKAIRLHCIRIAIYCGHKWLARMTDIFYIRAINLRQLKNVTNSLSWWKKYAKDELRCWSPLYATIYNLETSKIASTAFNTNQIKTFLLKTNLYFTKTLIEDIKNYNNCIV